jgi:hypothetical protein
VYLRLSILFEACSRTDVTIAKAVIMSGHYSLKAIQPGNVYKDAKSRQFGLLNVRRFLLPPLSVGFRITVVYPFIHA